MKKSFVKKIFSGVFLLLFIVFLVQLLFQRVIFPVYYLKEVQQNIKDELSILVDSSTEEQFLNNLDKFSQYTQTTTHIMNINSTSEESRDIYPITVIKNEMNEYFSIFIPKFTNFSLQNDDLISGRFYLNTRNNTYIPKVLLVNDVRIYGESRMMSGMHSKKYMNWLSDNHIDFSNTYDLQGRIIEMTDQLVEQSKDINVSREILNLSSGNITNLKETSFGLSYISNIENKPTNLVYTSRLILDGKEHLAITIYPLSNISLIAKKLTSFNILMYLIAFLILLGLSVLYIKKVSVPLIKINETTKRLAKLDFTQIDEVNSEDEIGELSKSINLLSANLKTALSELNDKNEHLSLSIQQETKHEQLRQDFVAGLSHELKTPLAVIQASSEGLSLKLFDKKQTEEQYKLIQSEINKSKKIIQDMMQVYKIEQSNFKTNWREFKLKDVIKNASESLNLLAEAKGIKTIINLDDTTIFGDENKFELVISNLFSNAIKYTNEFEEIVINLKKGFFEIINTGITIPKESINDIFEPFYRVDKGRSRKTGSTGLGLYIVKQILEQHELNYGAENLDNAVRFFFRVK
ncbi:HAMP domain-containing protein [Mycoplasmatota bacterium]|nr:HAMP domain-containing protein [Mycoplasmatota bacterium]